MNLPVETIAFRMVLNAGMKAEYQRRHDEIWPELVSELRQRGVLDYWIFLDEASNHLFAFLVRRKDHHLDELPQQIIMKKWWAHMADIMATNADQSPVQQPLLPVFHLP